MEGKTRLILFFVFTGIFALVFQIGSMTEVSSDDAEKFLKEFESLVEGIDGFGIFIHNLTIALPMFIPGFGVAWGLFSGWSTGFAFASIVSATPELGSIPPLAILFFSPFGIMELASYSLAISRSFILMYKVLKKIPVNGDLKPTLIEIAIVVVLLLAGGFLEFAMIEMAKEMGPSVFEPAI